VYIAIQRLISILDEDFKIDNEPTEDKHIMITKWCRISRFGLDLASSDQLSSLDGFQEDCDEISDSVEIGIFLYQLYEYQIISKRTLNK
jgi:hypothetical protein